MEFQMSSFYEKPYNFDWGITSNIGIETNK